MAAASVIVAATVQQGATQPVARASPPSAGAPATGRTDLRRSGARKPMLTARPGLMNGRLACSLKAARRGTRQRQCRRAVQQDLLDEMPPAASSSESSSVAETPETDKHADPAESEPEDDDSSFDWLSQWYPMIWERDLEIGKPTKATLFDVDYCLLRQPESLGGRVLCLKDACPHRLAALSEGRMTDQGHLQCGYHGWSFDGTGKCVDIPSNSRNVTSKRACTSGLPCRSLGGLVWVFPGASEGRTPSGPPPALPQMMPDSGWSYVPFVRDFPVDYTMLIENITDPDHGVFVHQTAVFDWYGGNEEHPQHVTVEQQKDKWSVTSRATPVNKITWRAGTAKEKLPAQNVRRGEDGSMKMVTATVNFTAPCFITSGRRDENGDCDYSPHMWIVPTGLGRCRLLVCNLGRSDRGKGRVMSKLPRWLISIKQNHFLDQDTHVIATAQEHYLPWEMDKVLSGEKMNRRSFFKYQSPSENLIIAIGKFMDNNLPNMPNRYSSAAMKSALSMGIGTGRLPPRSTTMDRWKQHTEICPDSMGAVRKATLLMNAAATGAAACLLAFAVSFGRSFIFASAEATSVLRIATDALVASQTPLLLAMGLGLVALASSKIVAEFSYRYDEQWRDSDLAKIPSLYPDNYETANK